MTTESPVVFVVDDDSSIRSSLRRLLRAAGHTVQTFSSTQQVFKHGRPDGPCCLVLDVLMPDGDGLSFQEMLIRRGIQVPIIFMTGCGDIPMSVRAMKAGAVDFLPKPYEPAQLLDCVKTALMADAESLLYQHYLAEIQQRYSLLSPREREVFAGVSDGNLNKQVATDLGVAEKTIKVHRGRVMQKMGAAALADLVRMADLLSLGCENGDSARAEASCSQIA